MSNLFKAMNAGVVTTTNGMPAFQSTMSNCVDLFFKIGASRGKFTSLIPIISKAMGENLDLAIRVLLWSRDVRGGAGERSIFKEAIPVLFRLNLIDETIGNRIADRVPDLGRWDDLFAFIGTPSEKHALSLIQGALEAGNGLCAKWMPREKNNPVVARKLMQHMELTPRNYRRLLVALSNVVETQMCEQKWTDINYGHVPSVASARYQKAFGRHDSVGYAAYLNALEKGEAKINAGAIYPYDVVKSVRHGNNKVADQQWKALPDYLAGDNSNTLCVVDVSGSMDSWDWGIAKGKVSYTFTPMDVAVSLGLYLSERNTGVFKDKFITFSDNPHLQMVNGSLSNRIKQMMHSDWSMSTNIEAVFKLILKSAEQANLTEADMPTRIIILSDMQFNQCVKGKDKSVLEMIKKQYDKRGYKIPQVVFWNINSHDNVPVEFDQSGAALVSGFSPSVMAGVLGADVNEFTPEAIMKKTVMVDRYNY